MNEFNFKEPCAFLGLSYRLFPEENFSGGTDERKREDNCSECNFTGSDENNKKSEKSFYYGENRINEESRNCSEKEKRAEEFNENDRNDEENDGEKFNREKPLDEREIRKNRTWHEALKRSPDCGNTVSVLNCLVKNVGMAYDCINAVLPFVKNERFANLIESQEKKYGEFLMRGRTIAEDLNVELEPSGKLSQSWANLMIKMKLMMNSCTSRIAEMMIQGTTMGVIDMGRLLRHTPDVLPKTLDLAREIMEFEEDKIEILKYYL